MPNLDFPESLWSFALAFYAQPGVEEICLTLQDCYEANVCLLISLRWLDKRDWSLDDNQLNELTMHAHSWTEKIIKPIRSLRRQLKVPIENIAQDDMQEQLRVLLKQAELLAEKKLLIEVERWVYSQTISAQGSNNLERYLKRTGSTEFLQGLTLNPHIG